MAAEANLGRWEAREVESVPIAAPATARTPNREPLPMPPSDGDDVGDDRPGPDRVDRSFWLGVLVGLVPLVLLIAGYAGYRLTTGGESDEEGTAIAAVDTAGSPLAGPADGEADLPVQTAPAPSSASPSTASASAASSSAESPSTTALEATLPTVPIVASGVVTDGSIEVRGVFPDEVRIQWVGELADLAAVLGYRLDDRTEAADPDGPAVASELLVRFPGAVVFQPGSSQGFDSEAQPIFEAIAGVLNRGSADLTIAAYAEPADAAGETLAAARAEHVDEHLAELGVELRRLSIEVRTPNEAPIVAADGSPIERRVDLEFRFRP